MICTENSPACDGDDYLMEEYNDEPIRECKELVDGECPEEY